MHLHRTTLTTYFVLQSLHNALPSTTLYTTKLALSTSQYYFVLHSLHKVRPNTTLYYKAFTQHFPVLLCTTKLPRGTSQYYFVFQSLRKVHPNTFSYYKACTKYFPVLFRATKLPQGTSQYYFVLQSLHKALPSTTFVLQSLHRALPSTTLYRQACAKHIPVLLCRRKFRSQSSDNMERWKSRGGKSQGWEAKKWEDQRRERVGSKKMQVAKKVGKSRCTVFFQWFGAPEGRKLNLAKAAGAEPAGQMRDEKLHAVVARSAFSSQNVQNTPGSDHFWKILEVETSKERCAAKHKSKVSNTHGLRPLLEVEMSKKCAPLWREAHFQVKSVKNSGVRTIFWRSDVQKVHAVVAWSTFPSQKCKELRGSGHFGMFRCGKVDTD